MYILPDGNNKTNIFRKLFTKDPLNYYYWNHSKVYGCIYLPICMYIYVNI